MNPLGRPLPQNIISKFKLDEGHEFITNEILESLLILTNNAIDKDLAIYVLNHVVYYDTNTGCWFKSKDWSSYSTIDKVGGHRVSYKAFNGPLIKGLEICHHCDRRGCFNPFHLFQGTHSRNMNDALNKNRLVKIDLKRSKKLGYILKRCS